MVISLYIIIGIQSITNMEQLEREDTVLGNQQQGPVKHQQSLPAEKPMNFIQQFDWQIENFHQEEALKEFSKLADQNMTIKQQANTGVCVTEVTVKSSGLSKNTFLIIKGSDGVYENIQIVRKYSDFYELRQALVRRWPTCFIPPIPELGNIGITENQINKNKKQLINSFLKKMSQNQYIYSSQEFQIFMKAPESQVSDLLQKLKPKPYHELLKIYKEVWNQCFIDIEEEELNKKQIDIKNVEEYFMEKKHDLTLQKNELKRLAELRTKLEKQRFHMLEKLLPEYESVCLDWFVDSQKPGQNEEEEGSEQKGSQKIYSSEKYRNLLQGYQEYLLPQQNLMWGLYEMFKFEQRQIDALLQTITQYRYLITDKKYYIRNIKNNTEQIEDLNNKNMSLKILLLSGTEDEKKTQLANETQNLENKLAIVDQLYVGMTNIVLAGIQDFKQSRCESYKRKMIGVMKNEALFMGKLFNLYIDTEKI